MRTQSPRWRASAESGFGTSEPAGAQKAPPKPLRRAPSGLAPPKTVAASSAAQPECIARSRSSLAALVESDLFPDTPRRCTAASKTATPAVTPTLPPVVCKSEAPDNAAQQRTEGLQKVNGVAPAAAAAAGTDSVASPVRTPSPVAGSPRSLQASETQSGDVAGVVSQKLSRDAVKREESGSAPHGTYPQRHLLILPTPSAHMSASFSMACIVPPPSG